MSDKEKPHPCGNCGANNKDEWGMCPECRSLPNPYLHVDSREHIESVVEETQPGMITFDVVARETGPILQSVCNDVLDALQAFALQPPDLEIDGVLARKYALEYLRSLSNDPLVYLAALAMRAEVERRRIA